MCVCVFVCTLLVCQRFDFNIYLFSWINGWLTDWLYGGIIQHYSNVVNRSRISYYFCCLPMAHTHARGQPKRVRNATHSQTQIDKLRLQLNEIERRYIKKGRKKKAHKHLRAKMLTTTSAAAATIRKQQPKTNCQLSTSKWTNTWNDASVRVLRRLAHTHTHKYLLHSQNASCQSNNQENVSPVAYLESTNEWMVGWIDLFI